MVATYHTTGSGELPPIVFVEGTRASTTYGVSTYSYTGPCIECKFPLSTTLHFNPCDGGHYYLHCGNCGNWFRWLNPNGSNSDWKIVTTDKRTPLDINVNPLNNW